MSERVFTSVNGSRAFVPAHVRVRIREHAPVLLQRRNQVRNELDGHDDLCAHRSANHVLALGLLDFSFRKGMTSQKVSVKSKGVCAMEQKFAYVRGAPSAASSAGTMVKLICLGWSAMPEV